MRIAAILSIALALVLPASFAAADNSYNTTVQGKNGPRPGQEWPFSYPYYGVGICTLKCGEMLKVCSGYATNTWGLNDCRQRHSVCEGDCSRHQGPGRRR